MATYNTVKIKKYLDIINEWPADAAITPGMLLELISTNKVKAHATADGSVTPKMFALEDELQGKEVGQDYIAGDPVQVWVAVPGEEVNALLADGEHAVIGSKLASNGNGYLKVVAEESAAQASEQIVGIALEETNRSGSSGEDTNITGRIRIMIS